jgi:ATP-dependent DNA helicase RecG
VEDASGSFHLIFFHARGDWLVRTLPEGEERIISGKLELYDGTAQMTHPDHILTPSEADALPKAEPVYPLGQGVTQRLMWRATADVLARVPHLEEWIDPGVIAREAWPSFVEALRQLHRPETVEDAGPNAAARRRIAYDELFSHQITLQLARQSQRRSRGRATSGTGYLSEKARAALPYRPTGAQERAVAEILSDMASPERMNRLLQGDVGSGKTLVAFLAMLAAVDAGG